MLIRSSVNGHMAIIMSIYSPDILGKASFPYTLSIILSGIYNPVTY
jgi:hypothetical protein